MTSTQPSTRAQLEEQGYVVVHGAVPPENLEAVIADIWRHTGASPDDRESWYLPGIISSHGMVQMYHYQSMWDNRQHPVLHRTFADIFGTERLWVSLDRTNLKPPADPAHPEHNDPGFIHWDTDTSQYPDIPFRVQGVLALTDTDEQMGGFQCVPQLYRELGDWIARQPADRNPRKPDLAGYQVEQIPLRAGDMVIWSTLLPHGNGHNVSDRPRLAQYISMNLANEDDEAARQARVNCWQHRLPPPSPAFKPDPRGIEEGLAPPELTPLGRKLLGLDRWDGA
jgi:ectoine hydroxylase-related dioxygenase (phytanoyl-CoA dioxygenase family)